MDAVNEASLPLLDLFDPAMRSTVRRAYVCLQSVHALEDELLARHDPLSGRPGARR